MNISERMAGEWRDSGIERGDTVLLHSRIGPLMRRYRARGTEPAIGDVLESFLAAVGPQGSILFPAFRYDFAQGKPFDMRTTPSGMGSLSELARQRCDQNRTGHPFFSFSVFGRLAPELKGVINLEDFGDDSPFHRLHLEGGKIAVLDLDDQHSMTFYHYVERRLSVPYRFTKHFTGTHVDLDGTERRLTFDMFVRDLDAGVVTDVNPMGELLWQQGLYRGNCADEGTGLRTIATRDLFDATAKVIQTGQALGHLYRIEPPAPKPA